MKEFSVLKSLATLALLFALLFGMPAARADLGNHAVKVTFSQAVQVPGLVLPAGTYWFVVPEGNELHEVRILNADRTRVFTTVLTNDAQRTHASGHGEFKFAERGLSEPQAIVAWFYPGDTAGHEFLYPKQVQKELATAKVDTVVAGD